VDTGKKEKTLRRTLLQSYSGFWLQKKRIATRDSEEAQQGSARKGSPAFFVYVLGEASPVVEK
jgi:hypothetical protein